MNYISEHRTAFISTIVTHTVILLLLMFFGFFAPLPLLPGEEGILVNFGDSETGIGAEEPAPGESAPANNPEEKQVKTKTPPPPAVKKVTVPIEKEEIVTQDLEKTVVMESAKKKIEIQKAKVREEDKILKEKRKEELLEKQQQAEAERLQKAEIARQEKEEAQKLAMAAAENRKANEINSRVKNAFGGTGNGTGAGIGKGAGNGKGAADSKSTGQGVTFGPGNQGSPGGSANVNKYGPGGGSGNGTGNGNGTSFNLDGRRGLSLPKPQYPGTEDGIVVVQVTVDKNGTVTNAEPGVKGSNTANPELISAARKAALQAKFNVDKNAPAFQVGTITYRFVLD